MGIYLNPDNILFQEILKINPFIDKSLLIAKLNSHICTSMNCICITRPRYFGKTITADMLTAYYTKGASSRNLFADLKIASEESFDKHLNKYNVIRLTMTDYLNIDNIDEMEKTIVANILNDLYIEYPSFKKPFSSDFDYICYSIFEQTNIPIVFIIDEYDCIIHKFNSNEEQQKQYSSFLRDLLKDKSYVALAYMTGVLPIKKYRDHSGLNMFRECSMQYQGSFSEFTGFTEEETESLCREYSMDYEEVKKFYYGYTLNKNTVYNPLSIVKALTQHKVDQYWVQTEKEGSLKKYILMDKEGLREQVALLIAGERIPLEPRIFKNDMVNLDSANHVLTLLLHLGYLSYDYEEKVCWIPNEEIWEAFYNSIEDTPGWEPVVKAIKQSEICLKAILAAAEATLACDTALKAAETALEAGDSAHADTAFATATEAEAQLTAETDTITRIFEEAHQENASRIRYYDENALACVVTQALYTAPKDYKLVRARPSVQGGHADIVLLPRPGKNRPAIVIELKKDTKPSLAIQQIKNRHYPVQLFAFSGEIILVEMSYSTKKGKLSYKRHLCKIEKITKELNPLSFW